MPEDQDDIYGVSSTNKAMLYFTERISIKMQNKNNTKDIYYAIKWLRRWGKDVCFWNLSYSNKFLKNYICHILKIFINE